MSFGPSVNFVCQRALRKIGEFALRASGPRPEAMEEARYWLDMVVAHVAAMERTWWLVPETGTLPLVPGQREYDLTAALGPGQAPDGVQFVAAVSVVDAASGKLLSSPPILRRLEFEETLNANPGAVGLPTACYIDRDRNPTLKFVEEPDTAHTVRVVFQAYAPNLVQTQDMKLLSFFRDGWTMYLVTALSERIGNGPVRKLPADEVRDMRADANKLLYELHSYDHHEQHSHPRRVQFHNLG